MESGTLTPDTVSAPDSGRQDALTTIAPFVEYRVDDVLVRHLDLPGLTTVRLAFGVGLRDEPAHLVGITHLVEHLVMAALPTPDFEHNASVDSDLISFTATGTADEVTHFIRDIGAALQNLDLANLPRERRVVHTECQSMGAGPHDMGLAFNFGIAGPGLALVEPRPERVRETDIVAHAVEYLCKENATLTVVGPMPEVLTIPLPSRDGVLVTNPYVPLQPRNGMVWVEADSPTIVLTMHLPAEATVAEAMAELLHTRLLNTLRHGLGISYEVALELTGLEDAHLAVVTVDALQDREDEVARTILTEVVSLAVEGPALEELLRIRRLARRDVSSPYLLAPHLDSWQVAMGRALTYFEPLEHAEFRDAVSVQTLRDHFSDSLGTVAILVPRGHRPFGRKDPIKQAPWCPSVAELPEGLQFRPTWRSRFLLGDRRERIIVTDDVLAHRERSGRIHEIWWEDVVAVEAGPKDPRDLLVIGTNRCSIPVEHRMFGRRAVRRVRDRLEQRGLM